MLAPQDPPTNAGESSDALVQSSTSSRAPQVADHQIDDAAIYTSSSVMTSSSPQFIGDPVHAVDSPPRTPSTIRYAQVQSLENSPSVSHPHAYTPPINHPHASLPTTTHASSYVPPPSPEQSHGNTYQVPSSYYGKMDYQQGDGTSGQYQQQYAYQQNLYYQQQQHAYPEPVLVDTTDEKVKPSEPVDKPVTMATTNGRRKRIIWIGALVILVLIGAIIGLVIATKNKSSDNNNDLPLIPSTTPSTTPTRTAAIPSPRPGTVPTSSIPVTVSTSSIPVTVPTPESGGGGGSGITPPPLPSLPPQCGTSFCNDYYRNCRFTVCAEDSDYKACVNKCGGPDNICALKCLDSNPCQKQCQSNRNSCYSQCN